MRKRLLTAVLAVVMALTLLPTAALAAEYTVVEVVPCKYDYSAYNFHNGLAMVRVGDATAEWWGWGFVDKTGKEVVPCKYAYAEGFSEGLAVVKLNGNYGFVDKTGKVVVIPLGKYYYVDSFSEGLAAVTLCGESELGDPIYKRGFIDKTGKEVIPCKYDLARKFSEGLAAVELNGKYGFIDKTGQEIVPFKYDHVRNFSEGLAAVAVDSGEKDGWGMAICKWGFIDKTGKEVVPCKYDDVGNFSEGLAWVRLNGKWGFVDKTGKEVVPIKYGFANDFYEGLAAVTTLNGKRGFVDKTGKEVIPCKYDATYGFSEGLAPVRVGDYDYQTGKWGFIDKTGKEVIPCKYDLARKFSEGLAAVELNGKYGFIDKTGQEIVPFKYDDARNFSEGLAAVAVDSGEEDLQGRAIYKWGYITVRKSPDVAHPSTQNVSVDGKAVEFHFYALKDENGNDTNYIKLRDVAAILNGTAAQFEVGYDGKVLITTGKAYTPNGSEQKTPFSGQREYETVTSKTIVDGAEKDLAAFTLTDDNGGGYTYYKLRDLGQALGFNVGWSDTVGVFVETDKPYDPSN